MRRTTARLGVHLATVQHAMKDIRIAGPLILTVIADLHIMAAPSARAQGAAASAPAAPGDVFSASGVDPCETLERGPNCPPAHLDTGKCPDGSGDCAWCYGAAGRPIAAVHAIRCAGGAVCARSCGRCWAPGYGAPKCVDDRGESCPDLCANLSRQPPGDIFAVTADRKVADGYRSLQYQCQDRGSVGIVCQRPSSAGIATTPLPRGGQRSDGNPYPKGRPALSRTAVQQYVPPGATQNPDGTWTLEGRARRAAWSGPFWTYQSKSQYPTLYEKDGPLEKYRELTGDNAPIDEEKTRHSDLDGRKVQAFGGHCDGFAVSSTKYEEPRYSVRATIRQWGVTLRSVDFSPGRIKGLLAALWSGYDWSKTREGRTLPPSAGVIVKPSARQFHEFLLQAARSSDLFVVNLRPPRATADAVWNWPCDGFKLKGSPDKKDLRKTHIEVTLQLAEDRVGYVADSARKPVDDPTVPTVEYWIAADGQNITADGYDKTNSQTHWNDPDWIYDPEKLGSPGYNDAKDGNGVPSRDGHDTPYSTIHRYADPNAHPEYKEIVERLARVSAGGPTESWIVPAIKEHSPFLPATVYTFERKPSQ